jgi:hypothetical protein
MLSDLVALVISVSPVLDLLAWREHVDRQGRAAEADVRLACFRELPDPRVDRHGRVVADTDAEIARIERETTRKLAASAPVFDGVPVETVVRFGHPTREAPIEAEVYAPQIVVVFAAARGLVARLRHWVLRRRLAGGTTPACWWWPRAPAPPSPGRWAGQPSDRRHPSQHIASEIRVLGPAAA